MRFARWVFLVAGVYGVLVLVTQSFMERQISAEMPAGDHAAGVLLRTNIGPVLGPSILKRAPMKWLKSASSQMR